MLPLSPRAGHINQSTIWKEKYWEPKILSKLFEILGKPYYLIFYAYQSTFYIKFVGTGGLILNHYKDKESSF